MINNSKINVAAVLLFVGLSFCSVSQRLPAFKASDQPPPPDYSKPEHWSALPFRTDAADALPFGEESAPDEAKEVDVFYVYPTIYGKGRTWNADVNNQKLNRKIDKLPVKFQASVFNHVGRVYAPRYRQGIIKCFSDTTANSRMALDFAYSDVKKAFEYYLKHYNQNRPFFIASHSQGSLHLRRLLAEVIDKDEMLRKKMVAAYVVGFGIFPENYEQIGVCTSPDDINCFLTWSTFKSNFHPATDSKLVGNVCVNPITWRLDSSGVSGGSGILLSLKRKKAYKTSARINNRYLWVKTNTPFVRSWKNLHLVDYNLFWFNIRNNVKQRWMAYQQTYLK